MNIATTNNIDFRSLITEKVLADYFCGGSDDCLVVYQDRSTEIRPQNIATPANRPIASVNCLGIHNMNLSYFFLAGFVESSEDEDCFIEALTGRVIGDTYDLIYDRIRDFFENGGGSAEDYDKLAAKLEASHEFLVTQYD